MSWELNTRIAAGNDGVFLLIVNGRLLMGAAIFVRWAAQDSNLLCFHVPVFQTGATLRLWRVASSVPLAGVGHTKYVEGMCRKNYAIDVTLHIRKGRIMQNNKARS